MASNNNSPPIENDPTFIPDGYVVVTGTDEQRYVVPQFMVPALHQSFDGFQLKTSLNASGHAGSVSGSSNIMICELGVPKYWLIGAGLLFGPDRLTLFHPASVRS
jgi:hypothetical protein